MKGSEGAVSEVGERSRVSGGGEGGDAPFLTYGGRKGGSWVQKWQRMRTKGWSRYGKGTLSAALQSSTCSCLLPPDQSISLNPCGAFVDRCQAILPATHGAVCVCVCDSIRGILYSTSVLGTRGAVWEEWSSFQGGRCRG